MHGRARVRWGHAFIVASTSLLWGCQMLGGGRPQSASPPPDPVRQSQRPEIAMQAPSPPPETSREEPPGPDLSAVDQYVQRLQQSAATPEPDVQRVVPAGLPAQRPPANALFAAHEKASPRAPVSVPIEPPPADGFRLAQHEEPAVPLVNDSVAAPTSATPPQVGRVTIRPAREPSAIPARESGVVGINAPVETSRIPTSLKGFLDQYVREVDGGSFRQQLDERILRVLVGDDDAARAPLQLVTSEQQKLAAGIIEALIASRHANPDDPTALSEGAVQSLSALTGALRDISVLRVPTVVLCWKVEGFGRYEEFNPPRFVAGRESELIVYSEVTGFSSTRDEQNWYRTSFDVTTSLVDRAGNVVSKFEARDIVDRCRNRRNDCFIPHLIRLPASLPPGEYVVKVTIADKLGKQVAENLARLSLAASL